MCTGLEVIALVGGLASAGGSLLQGNAARRQQQATINARNDALRETQAKNKRLQEEAGLKLQERFNQEAEDIPDTMAPLQERREEAANNIIGQSSAATPIPLGGNLPSVVADTAAGAQADTNTASRDRSRALAETRSFGDLVFDKNLKNQATARDLRQINGFVSANNQLLPIQQDLAAQSVAGTGRGMGTFGSILGALGGLGTSYAGSQSPRVSAAPEFSPTPVPRPTPARF